MIGSMITGSRKASLICLATFFPTINSPPLLQRIQSLHEFRPALIRILRLEPKHNALRPPIVRRRHHVLVRSSCASALNPPFLDLEVGKGTTEDVLDF